MPMVQAVCTTRPVARFHLDVPESAATRVDERPVCTIAGQQLEIAGVWEGAAGVARTLALAFPVARLTTGRTYDTFLKVSVGHDLYLGPVYVAAASPDAGRCA